MRCIDVDALIDALGDMPMSWSDTDAEIQAQEDWRAYREALLNAPTIEPERKKGKWQWMSSTYDRTPCELRYQCSECHHETIFHSNQMSNPWEKYCPNCGADMREGGDE